MFYFDIPMKKNSYKSNEKRTNISRNLEKSIEITKEMILSGAPNKIVERKVNPGGNDFNLKEENA